MWWKILYTIQTRPLFSLGIFLIVFPLPYAFFSGFPIFDHWPYNSGVLSAVFCLGLVIMYFGDRYEKKKDKDK